MSRRWNVFQGDQLLGLMTAQEIRRALRDGRLDPFDMVSAEGSEIRTELVEVDEIFQEHTQPDLEPPGATEVAAPPPPSKPAPAKSKKPVQAEQQRAFPPESTSSRSAMAFPPESTRTDRLARQEATSTTHLPKRIRSQTVSDKKKDKKFLLIDDKNRVLGPLTAVEVQSLFYRGILNKQVKVQKVGTDRKIPIRQFISAYSGKRMKALADQGGKGLMGSPGHPSTKVLNELYHLINSKKLAETGGRMGPSLGLIALGIGLGLVVYLLFDWRQMQEDDSQKRRPQRPALIQSDGDRTAGAEDSGSPPRPSPAASEASLPRPASRPPQRPAETTATVAPAPRRQNNPPPAATRPPARQETRAPVATRPEPTPPPAPRTQPVETPPPQQPPSRAPTPTRSEPGPISQAMATAGSVISVGPLVFSQNDLDSCDLKCELTFRDSQGGQLTAVFFKGAYFDQLSGRGRGSVTLTGSSKLEGGKLILFIQDVR